MSDVTRILSAIEGGDDSSAEELLPIVYDELRRLAAAKLSRERSDHTIQATALVHDAYLRLVDVEKAQHWSSRGHFFSAAAEAMRRILVEHARRKASAKGGGQFQRKPLSESDLLASSPSLDLVALDEALTKFEVQDTRRAKVVKLRFFAGLTNSQAAEALGIARSTADADWAYARHWLRVELSGET